MQTKQEYADVFLDLDEKGEEWDGETENYTHFHIVCRRDLYYEPNYGADADGNRGMGMWVIADEFIRDTVPKPNPIQKRAIKNKIDEMFANDEIPFPERD